jgi:hypothetical protein
LVEGQMGEGKVCGGTGWWGNRLVNGQSGGGKNWWRVRLYE